jgi:hypothetical protein
VLALGLASLLILALVTLLDTSLTLWRKTDERRSQGELSSSVAELLAADLAALEGGPRGDLLVEWAMFDVDGDGVPRLPCARLRFVRAASAGEIERLQSTSAEKSLGQGLVEVCWAFLPTPPAAPSAAWEGVLSRGVRLRGVGGGLSFLDPRYFGGGGKPAPGTLEDVTGDVLWFEVLCASAGTDLERGWQPGLSRAQCFASWDARGAQRPDAEKVAANEAGESMQGLGARPELPRRIRVAFEVETTRGKLRRVTNVADVGQKEGTLRVDDASKLPATGAMLLIDEEWVELVGTSGNTAQVRRAQRGTRAAEHKTGALLRNGAASVREIVIPLQREDWRP